MAGENHSARPASPYTKDVPERAPCLEHELDLALVQPQYLCESRQRNGRRSRQTADFLRCDWSRVRRRCLAEEVLWWYRCQNGQDAGQCTSKSLPSWTCTSPIRCRDGDA